MTAASVRPLEVLVDLTMVPNGSGADRLLPRADWFTPGADRVTCVIGPGRSRRDLEAVSACGWTVIEADSAIAACNAVMMRAAETQAALLLLCGPVEATAESLLVLRRCLDADPMVACAAGRIRCLEGCCVKAPAQNGLAPSAWIPRRVLADLAEWEFRTELFECCLLIAPAILGEFGPLDAGFDALPGAMVDYLARARRCGYRGIVSNRAVMAISGASCRQPMDSWVSESDRARLEKLNPELGRGWEEIRAASNERFEELSAHAHRSVAGSGRRSLLLDVRNLGPLHNGTSRAALGCVEAIYRLSAGWDVTLLIHPSAAAFHGIQERCPKWKMTGAIGAAAFTAGLRLSQPWHIQEMIDLHRASIFNIYVMLDTISWDVVYPPPARLDGTWSFLADYADGLLFDSLYTQQRFLTRFAQAAGTPSTVCHYPFDRAEYVDAKAAQSADSDYILIVGNDLDHKDAGRTVELISAAFPFRPVVSLGPTVASRPYLKTYRSGTLPESDVDRLYAGAKMIVFPSFYEGFGFPIVTTLAYGKTLIARRSALLEEIVARCSGGRVVPFSRRDELVPIIGRLLKGEPVEELPVGRESTGRRWADVGQDMMAFVDRVVSRPGHAGWIQREHAVNQLVAYRI